MAVIFPDIEKTIVAYLKSVLASNVLVAVKKAPADKAGVNKQVVVTAAYQGEEQHVMKTASVTIDVFANTYADCSELALLVDAHIRGVVGHPIKKASVLLGPVRIAEQAGEHRSLDVEVIVQGSPL